MADPVRRLAQQLKVLLLFGPVEGSNTSVVAEIVDRTLVDADRGRAGKAEHGWLSQVSEAVVFRRKLD
jgi:hypothetical protein